MQKNEAHTCAYNVLMELICAGKAPLLQTGDAKTAAEYQVEQLKLIHEKLYEYFIKVQI